MERTQQLFPTSHSTSKLAWAKSALKYTLFTSFCLSSALSIYTYLNFKKNTGFNELNVSASVFKILSQISSQAVGEQDETIVDTKILPTISSQLLEKSVLIHKPLKHIEKIEKIQKNPTQELLAQTTTSIQTPPMMNLSLSETSWLKHYEPLNLRTVYRSEKTSDELKIAYIQLRKNFKTATLDTGSKPSYVMEEVSVDKLAKTPDQIVLSSSFTQRLDAIPESKPQPQKKFEYSSRFKRKKSVSTQVLNQKNPALSTFKTNCSVTFKTFKLFESDRRHKLQCFKVISHEGSSSFKRKTKLKWYLSENKELGSRSSIDLLIYKRDSDQTPIPLLDDFSKLNIGSSSIESNMGHVFGFLPPNENIELSGRHGSIAYFDSDYKLLSEYSSEARFFLITNVEPGSPLLYFQSKLNSTLSSSVPLWIKPKTMTLLPQVSFEKLTLRGKLIDSQSKSLRGVSDQNIEIVGYPSKVAITQTDGEFKFESIRHIVGAPLILDVHEGVSGVKHRYQVDSSEAHLSLFYFAPQVIQSWLKELESQNKIFSTQSSLLTGFVKTNHTSLLAKIGNSPVYQFDQNSSAKKDALKLVSSSAVASMSPFLVGPVQSGVQIFELFSKETHSIAYSQLIYSQPGVLLFLSPAFLN